MLIVARIMMRPRLMPRLAATICFALFCAPAGAAEAVAPQSYDDAVPSIDPASAPKEEATAPPPVLDVPGPLRRTAIYYAMGLATPIGFLGFESVHRFGKFLELSAGIGIGGSAVQSNRHSFGGVLQWSLMPRLRLGNDHAALTLGAGVSGGEYGGFDVFGDGPGCPSSDSYGCSGSTLGFPTQYTLWRNLEIGGEYWSRGGFALRYFVGLALGMTVSPFGGSPLGGSQGSPLPYFGLGLGYAS
jgi:hypothetical protein